MDKSIYAGERFALMREKTRRIAHLLAGPDAWILVGAFAFRFWSLAVKPPHFDEGINGYFVQQMWRGGFFKYDPTNFHGPLYFYLLQLAELTFGWGIWSFRAITALASLAIVAQALAFRPFVGRAAARWAAALMAVSPAFVFYGRYAIHETVFVLGQIWFVYGLLRFRQRGGVASLTWMTAGIVVMATTKETFVVFLATVAIAWALTALAERASFWNGRFASGEPLLAPAREPIEAGAVWARAVAGVIAIFALFSGFGMNREGIRDFFAAFMFWTKTGVGSTGHEKPITYWLELVGRYEIPLALGLAAALALIWRGGWLGAGGVGDGARKVSAKERRREKESRRAGAASAAADVGLGAERVSPVANRFLALLGLGLFAAYSIIPYKTPWCLLSAAWPLAFAFGALPALSLRARWPVRIACAGALAWSGVAAWRLAFVHFADPTERYVYVQTTEDFTALQSEIEGLIQRRPEQLALSVLVLLHDPWPLPWAYSRYPNASFVSLASGPPAQADVIVIDERDKDAVERGFKRRYRSMPFHLRDAGDRGFAYLATDLFGGGNAAEMRGPAAASSAEADRAPAAEAAKRATETKP